MRGLLLASGLIAAIVLSGAPTRTRADDDAKTYDLRGPAPVKGQVFISTMKLKIKDADTTLKIQGSPMPLKMKVTMDITGEEEEKVLSVDGRNVTKCQSKVLKDRSVITTDLAPAQTEVGELEGEVIISDRIGEGKWKHSLVDTKPTEKQKRELDNRNGIENDDDLYPAEKVKVGHAWKVEAKALTKLFGNAFTDVKGELAQKFLRVEEYAGEQCAVIESTGLVKAKMKDEEGEPNLNVEMDLNVTSWRSIKSGVDLKEKIGGKIKLSGIQKTDDGKVDVTMSGPMSGESTTKLKE
jgi:hypothetical protein